MHIFDLILRVLLASFGWTGAFICGRIYQAEETWVLGRSDRLMEGFFIVGSAALILFLALT